MMQCGTGPTGTETYVVLGMGEADCYCASHFNMHHCDSLLDLVPVQISHRCAAQQRSLAHDRPSQYFYWDDIPARRLRPETLDRETAMEKAKAVARAAGETAKKFRKL
jgi:hypothetical protein